MRRRTPACLAAIAVLALACHADEDRAESARLEAREALGAGDLRGAREALVELRAHVPDTADALLELTSLMLQAGEAPQALWLLEEGVDRFAGRDDLRVQLARASLIVANPVLARSALEPLDRGSPQHLDALLLRAQAELDLGNLEGGLEVLEQAEQMYPGESQASAVRIVTLLRERRFDEAALAIEQARQRSGSEETSRMLELLAAALLAAQGDREAGIERLRELVEADPADAIALQSLVHALLRAERVAEALEIVEQAIARDPERAALPAILAQVHLQRGAFEEAERAIRSFVELSDSLSAFLLLSQLFHQQGELERVAEVFAEAVARFPDSAMVRMHLAESLIDIGRLDRAREQLSEFRKLSPDDPHVDYLRARLEFAGDKPAEAAGHLLTLVSRLDRAYTQYWLGRALEDSGDPVGAERRYGLALLRDPRHTAAVIALMRLAERRGDWGAVGRYALQLLQRAPAMPEGYATAISALARTGALEQAETLARSFRERFEDRARPAALLALVLRGQGRLDQAEEVLDQAERALGRHPELDAERAMVLATRGQLGRGIELLRRVVEQEPQEARHHALLAALLFSSGDGDAGSRAVDRALELAPEDPGPLELRARYLVAVGEFERARADCERYLAARPRDAEVQFMLGALLAEAGHVDQAIAAYRRAIELDERNFAARNNLALLLADQGELDGALSVAQEAYALADSQPDVVDTLGWLYLERGLVERSIALLEKAHAAAPEFPATQLHLALAYRADGRESQARRLLTDLLEGLEAGSPLEAEVNAALRSLED